MAPRVALVTGCAQGIGKGIVLRLAEDGYSIALNDIPSKKAELEAIADTIKQKGTETAIVCADVSVEKEVQDMIAKTVAELGSLDILVANAGIVFFKLLVDTTVEEWTRMQNINSKGVFLCFKYGAQQMIKQGKGGRLIGASSFGGKQGFSCGSAYAMAKFAVRGLIQSAALELGKHGITANGYAPGAIETQMLRDSVIFYSANSGEQQGTIDASFAAKSAVGRVGQPEDIAHLVSFWASEGSSFITGQTTIIDGGQLFD